MTISPRDIRRTCLKMLYDSQQGHVGSCMSVIDILAAVYGAVDVDKIKRKDVDRDRVILSKGHAAAALYATLAHAGILPHDALDGYCRDGSYLTGQANPVLPGVEICTGALGHGIPVGVGMALALRGKASVYVIVGDGEMQEGSNWEALALALRLNLSNLCVLVDANGLQMSMEVLDMPPMAMRLDGFGLNVLAASGLHLINHALSAASNLSRPTPRAIVCHTVKGKGVPGLENEIVSHYRPMDKATYEAAVEALEPKAIYIPDDKNLSVNDRRELRRCGIW